MIFVQSREQEVNGASIFKLSFQLNVEIFSYTIPLDNLTRFTTYEKVTLPTSSSGGFQVSVTEVLGLVLECVMVSLGLLLIHVMVLVLVLGSGVFHEPVVPLAVFAWINNP